MASVEVGDRFFRIFLDGVTIPPDSEYEVSRFIKMMGDYPVDYIVFAFQGVCPFGLCRSKRDIVPDRA